MAVKRGTPRTCSKGHQYYKNSDCPVCPICEQLHKPSDGFLSLLAAPARRALENAGIRTAEQLSAYTEKEILALHGIGKTAIPILKEAMKSQRLTFKK